MSPKGCVGMEEKETFASEMYTDLKKHTKFLKILVAVLLAALIVTNLYHIYQWSQFETVVVDSGEGAGNANYVQGNNTGGIYNGESGSTPEEEGQKQGSPD